MGRRAGKQYRNAHEDIRRRCRRGVTQPADRRCALATPAWLTAGALGARPAAATAIMSSAVGTAAATRVDELNAMHGTWLRKAGAQLHQAARFAVLGRQVGTEEEDVGFIAGAPVSAGETVVSVPSALLLNPSVVAASATGARIRAAAGAQLEPEPSKAAIFTIRYCIGLVDPADEYHLYFRSLPKHDPTTLSWPRAVRERLVGTSLGNATDRAEMLLHRSTDELALAVVAAGLCQQDAVSWERRCWARGMIASRRFLFSNAQSPAPHDLRAAAEQPASEPAGTEGWTLQMPLIDVANHSRNANCKLEISTEGASLVAARSIESGEELTLDYGNRGNEMLLLAYGFAIQNNPDDFYPVTLTAPAPVARGRLQQEPSGQGALLAELLDEQEQEEQRDLQALRVNILSAAKIPYEIHQDQSITIGPLPLLGSQHNESDSDDEQVAGDSDSEEQWHEEERAEKEQDQAEQVQEREQHPGESIGVSDDETDEEEADSGSSWASNHASGGLPFVLAALGVIGLSDADDEPGLTSLQLQELHTQLQVAMEQLLTLDCSSEQAHKQCDDQRSCVQSRPAKKHRATPAQRELLAPSTLEQELLSRVMWYQAGQLGALAHACRSVKELCERLQQAELDEPEGGEEDEEGTQQS